MKPAIWTFKIERGLAILAQVSLKRGHFYSVWCTVKSIKGKRGKTKVKQSKTSKNEGENRERGFEFQNNDNSLDLSTSKGRERERREPFDVHSLWCFFLWHFGQEANTNLPSL